MYAALVQFVRPSAAPRPLFLCALILGLLCAASRPTSSQELRQTVEWETFFQDDPAWLFGAHASFGWDLDREEPYPALGVNLGYVGVNHFYIGGTVDARLIDPHYLRFGLKLGALFTAADFTWGVGVTPGLLVVPDRPEAGLSITWGGMARLRLTGNQYLTTHLEADLLFDVLGFESDRTFITTGLGWAVTF